MRCGAPRYFGPLCVPTVSTMQEKLLQSVLRLLSAQQASFCLVATTAVPAGQFCCVLAAKEVQFSQFAVVAISSSPEGDSPQSSLVAKLQAAAPSGTAVGPSQEDPACVQQEILPRGGSHATTINTTPISLCDGLLASIFPSWSRTNADCNTPPILYQQQYDTALQYLQAQCPCKCRKCLPTDFRDASSSADPALHCHCIGHSPMNLLVQAPSGYGKATFVQQLLRFVSSCDGPSSRFHASDMQKLSGTHIFAPSGRKIQRHAVHFFCADANRTGTVEGDSKIKIRVRDAMLECRFCPAVVSCNVK